MQWDPNTCLLPFKPAEPNLFEGNSFKQIRLSLGLGLLSRKIPCFSFYFVKEAPSIHQEERKEMEQKHIRLRFQSLFKCPLCFCKYESLPPPQRTKNFQVIKGNCFKTPLLSILGNFKNCFKLLHQACCKSIM